MCRASGSVVFYGRFAAIIINLEETAARGPVGLVVLVSWAKSCLHAKFFRSNLEANVGT